MDIDPHIEVFPATEPASRSEAFQVRFNGYKRYFSGVEACTDELDHLPQTTLMLARHKFEGPLGTLRIIDRRKGTIELDQFLDLSRLLGEKARSCAEATRFSVPQGPHAKVVKLLLWKAFMRFCKAGEVQRMIVWTKPAASRDYRFLMFQSLGIEGKFRHPILGNREHETFVTEMEDADSRFSSSHHPLHKFMFAHHHPQIHL